MRTRFVSLWILISLWCTEHANEIRIPLDTNLALVYRTCERDSYPFGYQSRFGVQNMRTRFVSLWILISLWCTEHANEIRITLDSHLALVYRTCERDSYAFG